MGLNEDGCQQLRGRNCHRSRSCVSWADAHPTKGRAQSIVVRLSPFRGSDWYAQAALFMIPVINYWAFLYQVIFIFILFIILFTNSHRCPFSIHALYVLA
jgi:hypothetical protein